jgi:hypothetical protein
MVAAGPLLTDNGAIVAVFSIHKGKAS